MTFLLILLLDELYFDENIPMQRRKTSSHKSLANAVHIILVFKHSTYYFLFLWVRPQSIINRHAPCCRRNFRAKSENSFHISPTLHVHAQHFRICWVNVEMSVVYIKSVRKNKCDFLLFSLKSISYYEVVERSEW